MRPSTAGQPEALIHRLDCAGIGLAVHEWPGSAIELPPLVLLHGFTGSAATMSSIAMEFDERRVLAPDLVGHGETECPADLRHCTMAACVAQVMAGLEQLGVDQCDLLGYSMGARTALSLSAAHPVVRNLVLIGGTPGLADPSDRAARQRRDAELADLIEREGMAAFVDRWMAQPLFASQARLGAAALAAARTQRLHNDPSGLANSLRAMGTGSMPPLHDHLGELEQPAWWVHGAEDPKFAAIAEAAAGAMPHGQVVSIADAGHAAHLENPQAVAQALAIAFNPPRFPS